MRVLLREGYSRSSYSHALFSPSLIVMVWKGYETTQYAIEVGERTLSRAWEPLTWPFKITIPIASFLILLQGVAKFIRDLRTATTKGETK
jgi:TRAP-type mannitol/chloroaromatic compound transport system permease small subunit